MGSAQRVEEGRGSVRPFLDVACGQTDCRAFAVVRRVHLRQVVFGVVEMPHLLLCAVCGMAMPALASWCGPVRDLEEENMPKITRHGGPTNAAADGVDAVAAESSGEEESSPGSSSSTSPVKPQPSEKPSEGSPPRPAPTTASRSKKGRAGSSTARSTATSSTAAPDEVQGA